MNKTESKPTSDPCEVETLGQLAARVQAWLSGRVRDLRLEAGTGGVVLRGRARTWHAKQMAQHAVMAVAGLRVVANDIEVA